MIDDGLWEHYGTLATSTNNSEYVCQTTSICHSESTAVTSIGHKTAQDYVLAGCHCQICQICQATSAVLVLDMHWCSQASKLSHDLNGHPATQCSGLLHGVSRENNCPGRWLIHFPWNKYEHTIWTRRIWTHMNLSKNMNWYEQEEEHTTDCISVPCNFHFTPHDAEGFSIFRGDTYNTYIIHI